MGILTQLGLPELYAKGVHESYRINFLIVNPINNWIVDYFDQ